MSCPDLKLQLLQNSDVRCDHRCFECKHKDCDNDVLTFEELAQYREKEKIEQRETELMRDDLSCQRRWELEHPEKARANKQRHYKNNLEDYRKRNKQYYETHKEEIKEKQKIYKDKNREIINARAREEKRRRYNENPEYYRQKQREYRARKKSEKEKSNE